MSAWLCSEEHIYEIAHYYVKHCHQRKREVTDVAKILYAANIESLEQRYEDGDTPPMRVLSDFRPIVTNIHHMAKLVNCLDYQSCDYGGWEKSKAKEICNDVLYYLLANGEEYNNGPWEFDRGEYAKNNLEEVLDKVTAS